MIYTAAAVLLDVDAVCAYVYAVAAVIDHVDAVLEVNMYIISVLAFDVDAVAKGDLSCFVIGFVFIGTAHAGTFILRALFVPSVAVFLLIRFAAQQLVEADAVKLR